MLLRFETTAKNVKNRVHISRVAKNVKNRVQISRFLTSALIKGGLGEIVTVRYRVRPRP